MKPKIYHITNNIGQIAVISQYVFENCEKFLKEVNQQKSRNALNGLCINFIEEHLEHFQPTLVLIRGEREMIWTFTCFGFTATGRSIIAVVERVVQIAINRSYEQPPTQES